jgi:CRISPR type I-E-associated protein CasB/Cse2
VTEAPTETAAPDKKVYDRPTSGEVAFINELSKQDKGRLAILRRNAGNLLRDGRGIAWFYGLLSRYSEERSDEAYFLIATLYASDKAAIDGRSRFAGNLGATLRSLKTKSGAVVSDPSPLDRRFNILLDSDFDPGVGGELAFRLRQMAKLIIAEKDPAICINWSQLLHDIKWWSRENKLTQKSWAQSYYAPLLDKTEDTESKQIEE